MSPPPPPTTPALGSVAQKLMAAAPAIHLISHETVERMGTEEKIRFILDEVEAGKVLVLERGLTPQEEAKLIEQTMREVDPDNFIGIEMQSYGMDRGKNLLQRVAMGGPRPRMAVIGPASLLKLVSKDNEKIVTKIIGQDGGPTRSLGQDGKPAPTAGA